MTDLLQALQHLPETSLRTDWVVIGAAGIIVALQGWLVKKVQSLTTKVTEVTTYLFGVSGSPGGQNEEIQRIRTNVHELRSEVAGVKALVQTVEGDHKSLLGRIKRLESGERRSGEDRRHVD